AKLNLSSLGLDVTVFSVFCDFNPRSWYLANSIFNVYGYSESWLRF
ncbi:hypothetical protein D910_12122, partial [Dendroctonus ponderosae]